MTHLGRDTSTRLESGTEDRTSGVHRAAYPHGAERAARSPVSQEDRDLCAARYN